MYRYSVIYFSVWCPFEIWASQDHRTCFTLVIIEWIHRIKSLLLYLYLSRCVFCTIKNLSFLEEKSEWRLLVLTASPRKKWWVGSSISFLQTGNLGMWRWNHPELCQDSFFGFSIPSFVFYLPKSGICLWSTADGCLIFPGTKLKNITIKLNHPRGMPSSIVKFWGNKLLGKLFFLGVYALFSFSRIYCVWWSKKLFLRNPAPICLPQLRHMFTQKIKFTEMRGNQENQGACLLFPKIILWYI